MTCLPYDIVLMVAFTRENSPSYLRLLRMVRLIKLIRILRASRIFKRWEALLGLSFAKMAMIK